LSQVVIGEHASDGDAATPISAALHASPADGNGIGRLNTSDIPGWCYASEYG
jgi:hypothetical protein